MPIQNLLIHMPPRANGTAAESDSCQSNLFFGLMQIETNSTQPPLRFHIATMLSIDDNWKLIPWNLRKTKTQRKIAMVVAAV